MNEKNDSWVRRQINSLSKRLDEVSRRLEVLEKTTKPVLRARELRRMASSTQKEASLDHNYLKKTIDDAKKRYEEEHPV